MKINTRSHTGKIGHLPRQIRDQLGRGIHEGIPGVRLVAWLNSLPEVKAILARDFGGQPIKEQNLSKWKIRGYPDWIQEQAFMMATMDIIHKQMEKNGLPQSFNPSTKPSHATSTNQS
jgi:hypothetical protein